MSDAKAQKPLHGIRVLDFTRVLAGPYCTALLADLGADIIKVEPPQGDDYRHIGPFYTDGSSALFEAVNRGKRSVVLDLTRPEHRDIAKTLTHDADIVVENFRPGVATKLGIGAEDLMAKNERLIYASISGFGQDGPHAMRPAYDIIVQAMSGIMAITGDPAGPPTLIGESIGDVVAGLFGSWAILAALFERDRTGKGRHLDVAMFDSMMALQPIALSRFLQSGKAPQRVGNRHPLSAPFGAFSAKDGEFVLAVLNDKLFATLATLIEQPALASDPLFLTDELRLTHEAELRAKIEYWSKERTKADAVNLLIAAGVPAAEVMNTAQALSSDQAQARPILQKVHHPALGMLQVPEQPVRFKGLERGGLNAAPRLGDATDTIIQHPSNAWTSIDDQ